MCLYVRLQDIIYPVVIPSKKYELLNRISGQGLQIHHKFTRRSHIYSKKMLAIELEFTNTTDTTINGISIGAKRLQGGMSIKEMAEIPQLAQGGSLSATIAIDFNDTLQPAKFDIW